MEMMRESWTDGRMDDLNTKVDELGRRMDSGFNRVDADLRAQREEANGRFDCVDARFDALQRTLLQVGGGMMATLVAGFFGVIVTQL